MKEEAHKQSQKPNPTGTKEQEFWSEEGWLYKRLIEASPDLVWMGDTKGITKFINNYWTNYTGRKNSVKPSWTEKTAAEEEEWERILTKEGLKELRGSWSEAKIDQAPFEVEHQLRRKDGAYRWHLVKFEPMRSNGELVGWVAVGRDIQERKKAKEKLEENEAVFRGLANTIPQLAWMADAKGNVIWYNQRWYEFTGKSYEEMKKEGWFPAHDPKNLVRVKEKWTQCLRLGTSWEDTFPLKRYDESWVWHLNQAMPLKNSKGKIVKWFGTSTDISEQKKSEEEKQRLLENEKKARADAERANRLKDEFLATVSHELRTPLNAILGWTQLLISGVTDPGELQQGLETIERNAKSQTQIIEDLLDMGRTMSGKISLNLVTVDLAKVVEASIESLWPTLDAKQLEIEKEIEEGCYSKIDPTRIQQVCWNLMNNAIKFTNPKGKIKLRLSKEGENAVFQIQDNGTGIKKEALKFIFEPFRQEDSGTNRHKSGLGLGLAIAKTIIQLHSGTISANSAGVNLGICFSFRLKLDREKKIEQKETKKEIEDFGGTKILIVEDQADTRNWLRKLLEGNGAKVISASNADEGIRKMEEEKPDLLISDIAMPGKDGTTMLKEIRAKEEMSGKETPAIALSAFTGTEDKLKCVLAGFCMHVSKPIENEKLLRSVEMIIKNLVSKSSEKEIYKN